ncbi:MAG: hypothetical protein II318_01585 [Bacteroidales bacterium]|nr:hypothetical protein [Bacteroidales bacterium]
MGKIKDCFNRLFGTHEREAIKNKVLKQKIDFDNVVSSSLLSKELYDELKIVCHPDRFLNKQDIDKATDLFQLINQNKEDYNALKLLKNRVYNELPINN